MENDCIGNKKNKWANTCFLKLFLFLSYSANVLTYSIHNNLNVVNIFANLYAMFRNMLPLENANCSYRICTSSQ